MSQLWMLGIFDDEIKTLKAVRDLRKRGQEVDDVFMPYPVTEMPEALGLKHSRLGWVCFSGGILGGIIMMNFQIWTSAIDWAMNIGGRPNNSIPAFVPPTFEFAILLGALGTAAAALWRTQLFPGKEATLSTTRVTDDRFAVLVRAEGPAQASVREIFKACHAEKISESVEKPS